MTPSTCSHSNHPTGPHCPAWTRGLPSVERWAQASPTPPGAFSGRCELQTRARPLRRPNRVYLRLGLVFCLGILPTPHRGSPRHDEVSLGYPPLTCHRRTQTCTGWFHGFISVRRAGVSPAPAGILPASNTFRDRRHGRGCSSRRRRRPPRRAGRPPYPRPPATAAVRVFTQSASLGTPPETPLPSPPAWREILRNGDGNYHHERHLRPQQRVCESGML